MLSTDKQTNATKNITSIAKEVIKVGQYWKVGGYVKNKLNAP